MLKFWLKLGVSCWILTANANVLPRETGCRKEGNNIIGWTPKPTSGPNAIYAPLELFKRQQTTNTCGYFNGVASEPFTCDGAGYCAYNTINSAAGCCTGILTDCDIFTFCFDYAAYQSGECSNEGPLTGCCTDPQYPYCGTYYFPSLSMYRCVETKTTYSLDFEPTTSTTISTAAAQSSTTSTSTTATSTPAPTLLPTAPSTTSSSSILPTPAPSTASSPPIGAIVGGVVGGLAVIALIGLLIFLIMRRRRPSEPANYQGQPNSSVQPPVQQYAQQPPMQPMQPPMQPMQPPMQPMQPPMQQQSYAAPVYYTDQQTFPDNRQSIAKPSPYDSVTEQSNYGQYQNRNEGTQQSPMASPNPVYSPPSPAPPLYRPQSTIQTAVEMPGVPDPHHGAAELGQR